MNPEYESRQVSSMLNNYVSMNFIDLRLNTKELIKDFELFLASKKMILINNADGSSYEQEEEVGEPLANKQGITAITNMLLLRAHHHCIQGNFTEDHYWNNLCKTRKEITLHIIENCYEWGIEDNKLNYIIDNLLDFLEKVVSRLVDNKERESYMQQFQTREVINENKSKNPLQNFAGGMRGS